VAAFSPALAGFRRFKAKLNLAFPSVLGSVLLHQSLGQQIPEHKLITTSLLCQKLTEKFKVQGTCPVTTQKALQEIAHDSANECPYWRVVNASGGLIARFPAGTKGQAAFLRKEGFAIDTRQKIPKVKGFSESLVRFD
jgi:hypothetical protein